MTHRPKRTASPTLATERIQILDVFRGLAIFGIFMVNIEIMNATFVNQDVFAQQWTGTVDQLSVRILQLFFYSKFFPIFSFLFGLGISMQALKLYENNGLSFAFFARRMLLLFLFGALHIVLFWSGDVVHLYALLGLLITLLLRAPAKMILATSVLLLVFPFYEQVAGWVFEVLRYDPEHFLADYPAAEITRIIRHGSYLEGVQLRLLEYMANIPVLFVFLAPVALALFLLGLYIGKQKIIYDLKAFVDRIKKPVVVVTVLTNIYRVVFLFFLPNYEIYADPLWRPIFLKLMFLSDICMGLFYLWGVAWIWYQTNWRWLLKPLTWVGRMALTNYILQSVFGLFIFSGLGLGWYETLSPWQSLATATVVFGVQVLLSKLWLQYFRFGPLEWLWRCGTYKKWLPITKSSVR